ncbi:c-type cytochrome [Noviherbaspirillum denitrificans]|uniref:Cytochrome c class I n=1 Tax=Noviherbaspirillum denitrificans TaxID=1968433 RepID=A0A254TJ98_9BURK|nr:c-type cytochrome [Noviherbaspirillum denitrificans]OWW22696.1 cytochrome c class I [Noviherbaspirillum denitrificans]
MRLLALLGLLLSLAACSDQPAPQAAAKAAPEPAPRQEVLDLGRKVYNFRCYFCHGYSGNAQTLASTYLTPRPRDFTKLSLDQLSREKMLETVTHGRPGTAMKGFNDILAPHEIAAVTDFVRQEFMVSKARNTAYHTKENGWADHERYAPAFPFATGQITLDTPSDKLTAEQRAGRKLFMTACISCHDRAKVNNEGIPWDSRALSYPRMGFQPGDWPPKQVDGVSSATPYHIHDRVPKVAGLTAKEKKGEGLFQQNCAFCHAADGTGRNWIGTFLEPHPRDLTAPEFMSTMTTGRLANVIKEGLPNTSMPAWKSVLNDSDIEALIAYISRAFHPVAAGPAPAPTAKAP